MQCKKVENNPTKVMHHPWAWPSKPMDRIHLDFFGPYYGKNYLIMVDAHSKWCEVEIKNTTTTTSTLNTLRSWFPSSFPMNSRLFVEKMVLTM